MTFDGMASLIRNVAQAFASPPVQSDFTLHPPPQGDPEMTIPLYDPKAHLAELRRHRAEADEKARTYQMLAMGAIEMRDQLTGLAKPHEVTPSTLRSGAADLDHQGTLRRLDEVVLRLHARAGAWMAAVDRLTVQIDRLAVELKAAEENGQADG